MSIEVDPPPVPVVPASDPTERFRLRGGGALLLEAEGFRLIPARGLKRSPLHPYDSVTHIFANGRVLLIGTRRELLTVRASDFAPLPEPDEPLAQDRAALAERQAPHAERQAPHAEDLLERSDKTQTPAARATAAARRAILRRIAATEGGAEQLAAMHEVDALGERDGPAWIVWVTAALCLLGTAFQIYDPSVQDVGAFLPELFARGEYWRAITAQFLHELSPMPGFLQPLLPTLGVLPVHLAVNVAGLFVLGHLVERPLGSWKTTLVLALSGVGTIVGIVLAGHLNVVGSSGLVAGLAGAMLALEIHYSRSMPGFWRLPRRVFIFVILLQFLVLDQIFSSLLAGGAHMGGFIGGYLATFLLGRPSVESLVPTPSIRFGAGCTALLVIVGFVGALPLARREMPALERHAVRLLNTPSAAYLYEYDNAASWLIATEGGASDGGLELAVALADRAVANTGRFHPGVLDTLAEALFQRGDRLAAVLTIDEAIRLQPREPYFLEQRRRFTGERDPDDRPPPPGTTPLLELDPEGEFDPYPVDFDVPRMTI